MRPTRQTSPMMDALANTTDSGMMQAYNATADLGVLLSNMTTANLDFRLECSIVCARFILESF